MVANLLSADQVGELLDVDRSTVYRMASDGRLPAIKVGRQWRFPAERIGELLAAGPSYEPAIRDVRLPDLLNPATAQALIDLLAETLGVMMVVTDMDGRQLTEVANACPRFEQVMTEPGAFADCAAEWRELAEDVDFQATLRESRFGFLCARCIIRAGTDLVGMIVAGGIAFAGDPSDDVYHLSEHEQREVQAALPRIASILSRIAGDQRRLLRATTG